MCYIHLKVWLAWYFSLMYSNVFICMDVCMCITWHRLACLSCVMRSNWDVMHCNANSFNANQCVAICLSRNTRFECMVKETLGWLLVYQLSKRGTIVGRMEPCFDVRQSWDFFVLVKDNEVLISGVRYWDSQNALERYCFWLKVSCGELMQCEKELLFV